MFRALLALTVITSTCHASDTDDDTLRYYLSKSSLVVSGKILDAPRVVSSEQGVYRHSFTFKVLNVVKGEHPGVEINVTLTQVYQHNSEIAPNLKEGGTALLFLRQGIHRPQYESWAGADHWFAIQPANSLMESALSRVANEK